MQNTRQRCVSPPRLRRIARLSQVLEEHSITRPKGTTGMTESAPTTTAAALMNKDFWPHTRSWAGTRHCQISTSGPCTNMHRKKKPAHARWNVLCCVITAPISMTSPCKGTQARPTRPKDPTTKRANSKWRPRQKKTRCGALLKTTRQPRMKLGQSKPAQVPTTPSVQTQRSGGNLVAGLISGKVTRTEEPSLRCTSQCPLPTAICRVTSLSTMKINAAAAGSTGADRHRLWLAAACCTSPCRRWRKEELSWHSFAAAPTLACACRLSSSSDVAAAISVIPRSMWQLP